MLDIYLSLNVAIFFLFQNFLLERTKSNFALVLWYLPTISTLVFAYSYDTSYTQKVLLSLTFGVISFYLGIILGQRILIPNHNLSKKDAYLILLGIYKIITMRPILTISMQLGVIILYVILIGGLGSVPILNSGTAVTVLREDSFKNQGQLFNYLFGLSRNIVFPYISCSLFLQYLQLRSLKTLFVFLLSSSASLIYLSLSSALSPVLSFLLQLLLIYFIFNWVSGKKINLIIATLFYLFLIVISASLMVSLASSTDLSLQNSIPKLLQASFFRGEEVFNACSAFLAYASTHSSPYFGFSINPKISELLGINYININNHVFAFLNPTFSLVSTGTYNAPWFIYQYLSFGLLGVIFLSLFWGMLWGMQLKVVPLSTSAIPYITLVAYASFIFWDKPISTSALSLGGLSLLVAYFLILFLRMTFGKKA